MADHGSSGLGRSERDEYLVQHDIIEDFKPLVFEALGEGSGMTACALDETCDALSAEIQKRGPYLDATRSPR
jgi:hypothetical protein